LSDKFFDLSSLLRSAPFQRLLTLEKIVSPFEVYGIESSELVHSRILGALLSSEGPIGFGATLMPRLAASLRLADSRSPLDASWLVRLAGARFRIRLEHPCWIRDQGMDDLGRMDILLEDEARNIAIVIENKIWAGEQEKQIERYQTWLAVERKGWHTLVIYLTPGGGPPSQWNKARGDLPPCACMSWRDVHDALEGLENRDSSGIVRSFRQNIQRHIMGESEEKRLVREIMANPDLAAVVRTIVENLPKFGDMQSDIERGVREITGMKPVTKLYPPQRGDTREIMVYLEPWKEAGIPICFNFYDGDLPAVRTMVHASNWSSFEHVAKRLATYSDSAVHESCPIRQEWRDWRLVMADDSDTNESWKRTTVSDRSFSPDCAKALLAIFRERFEKLKPTIDRYLAEVKDRN